MDKEGTRRGGEEKGETTGWRYVELPRVFVSLIAARGFAINTDTFTAHGMYKYHICI